MANKSEETKPIFEAIAEGDLATVKSIIAENKSIVNIVDEHGMNPLQHAAYKGRTDMVRLLLDSGADVNASNHEYNYTALHFGALSGNSEVCLLLLNAGAKSQDVNSVGRTAAQMAAFIGYHHTVATINNFVPRSDLAYYSQKMDSQNKPYLAPFLVDPLHKFVLGVNVHPVRLALSLQNIPVLLDNAESVSKVLNMLSEMEVQREMKTNEVMSFKYYYLAYIIKQLNDIKEKHKQNEIDKEEKKNNLVEIFSRKLLKPGKDGVSLETMDSFLRDCIKEFPYRQCMILQQMVSALTSSDPPHALSVIECTINGQRGFVDANSYCGTCGAEKPAKKCSKCKSVQYCDRECQRLHWFAHKKACNRESSAPAPASNEKVKIDSAELSAELQNLVTR